MKYRVFSSTTPKKNMYDSLYIEYRFYVHRRDETNVQGGVHSSACKQNLIIVNFCLQKLSLKYFFYLSLWSAEPFRTYRKHFIFVLTCLIKPLKMMFDSSDLQSDALPMLLPRNWNCMVLSVIRSYYDVQFTYIYRRMYIVHERNIYERMYIVIM